MYNVHSLLHIVDDVKLYGNLDNYSAFPFESFMFKIKTMLHSFNHPLAEICNRIEESNFCHTVSETKKQVEFKKQDKMYANIYREIVFPSYVINCTNRDKWFIGKNGQVYSFEYCENVNKNVIVYARQIVDKSAFYNVPISSDKFEIFKSNGKLSGILKINLDLVHKKVFSMPIGDIIVFAPLRHTV